MMFNTWSDALYLSFQNLWSALVLFIPNIVVAFIILILGWVIGIAVGSWVATLVRALKIDKALQSIGFDEVMAKTGHKLNSGAFLGAVVKWFIIITFLVSSVNILGLSVVNDFLRQVVLIFVPNIMVAIFILFITAMVGEFLSRFVAASTRASGVGSANLLGAITKWAIWLFGLIAAMTQIGIAAVLFQTIFIGLVAMLAIAGGLAFGLGGRDAAARLIARTSDNLSDKV